MIRYTFAFTTHAKKRCIQRNIDRSQLCRHLLSIPFDTETNRKREWPVPNSKLLVVFSDSDYQRIIITVSYQKIKKGRDRNEKETN
ncbi:hypothetical protein J2S74_004960 [Evansella vedderi]|uniref:DUF4258 domain-containing protein n=1 Tax=Evansella vedderi TaxID=38282 RepID=A0ABU0A3B3_9BACI|nr:hypothetical protein [Evansella vedderi]MDQ0257502.1 hypothetical protein [Evansella vedderi]